MNQFQKSDMSMFFNNWFKLSLKYNIGIQIPPNISDLQVFRTHEVDSRFVKINPINKSFTFHVTCQTDAIYFALIDESQMSNTAYEIKRYLENAEIPESK